MVTEVIMPKMGQTMEKGKVVKWLKKEGEKVERGEPLLEIETDKTTIEVEARGSGILRKILAQEGEEAPIATIIAYIAGEGEPIPKEVVSKPKMPTEKITKEPLMKAPTAEVETKERAFRRIRASPLAKRMAEEKGVDLAQVTGTGPGGRITKEDVLKYLVSKPVEEPSLEFQVVPMSSMRKAIARKMAESKSHVPHFYVSTEVDMTEAAKLRQDLIPTFESKTGVRLSFTHLLVKAVAMALEEYPQLNSTFEEENIKLWKAINIGIAVSLEDGLIVPVLRNANKMSLMEIASEANGLVARAREKRLREDEFTGGTFTISNMGALDVNLFIAIINVPETAILGVGKISDKPAVVKEEIAIRKMMTMTLSADHRVVDGVLAAKFLQKVKELLEEPSSLTPIP
jgi:pyruvate dehydrogenase E2 component (dihydrolipoamide acetyltransferase)